MQNYFLDFGVTINQHITSPQYRNLQTFQDSKVGPWNPNINNNYLHKNSSKTSLKNNHRSLKKSQTQPKIQLTSGNINPYNPYILKRYKSLQSGPTQQQLQITMLSASVSHKKKRLPAINSPAKSFHYQVFTQQFNRERNYWQPNSFVYVNKYICENEPESNKNKNRNRNQRYVVHRDPLVRQLNFIKASRNCQVLKSKRKQQSNSKSKSKNNPKQKLYRDEKQKKSRVRLKPIKPIHSN